MLTINKTVSFNHHYTHHTLNQDKNHAVMGKNATTTDANNSLDVSAHALFAELKTTESTHLEMLQGMDYAQTASDALTSTRKLLKNMRHLATQNIQTYDDQGQNTPETLQTSLAQIDLIARNTQYDRHYPFQADETRDAMHTAESSLLTSDSSLLSDLFAHKTPIDTQSLKIDRIADEPQPSTQVTLDQLDTAITQVEQYQAYYDQMHTRLEEALTQSVHHSDHQEYDIDHAALAKQVAENISAQWMHPSEQSHKSVQYSTQNLLQLVQFMNSH